MLKLFQSIFSGGEAQGRYPESLVETAIERAVDGTDPRVRAVPDYRGQLRPSVVHAIDHVVGLIDGLPAALALVRGGYGNDPRLRALFTSRDRMLEVLRTDPALDDFRRTPSGGAERVTALLLAERTVRNVLGVDLDGEMLRRDVTQAVVAFSGFRLVDPAASEEQARRQLKRRAYDHLLSLALARIADVRVERDGLKRQRTLLQRKLDTLERGGFSFNGPAAPLPERVALQSELDGIERQLTALGADGRALRTHLDVTVSSLANAERQLWAEGIDLCLDPMNVQRDARDSSARSVKFQELHNSRGQRLVIQLISIEPRELPRREDFIAAAKRYLG